MTEVHQRGPDAIKIGDDVKNVLLLNTPVAYESSSFAQHIDMTHSLGINDINDCADFALVLSVVDEDDTTDFNKSSESLHA